jgi:predicted small secreted protein
MTRRHSLPVLAIVLCALVSTACGTSGGASFDVGLQKVALDLAFKDEEAAKKVPPARALEPVMVESQAELVMAAPELIERRGGAPRRHLPVVAYAHCPEAPRNAAPAKVLVRAVDRPATAGRFLYRDEGDFELTGPFSFKGKLPQFSYRDYRNPQVVPQPNNRVTNEPVPPNYTWEVVQPLGSDNYISRTFQATPTALQLVSLVYRFGNSVFQFRPTPAITMMDLGENLTETATWDSAGTDPNTGTSMVVRGGVEKREFVNACGEIVDTYKIRNSERIVNLRGPVPFTSDTDDTRNAPGATGPGLPNYYWVAPHYGGQFMGEETHTSTTIGTSIISIDGTSFISDLEPQTWG